MAIFFYLNRATKSSPDASAVIMMKVYHSRFLNRVCVCSTRERIERKHWVQRKASNGKYESGYPKRGHDSLQRRLMEIELQVTDFIRYNSRTLTRESLRKHLFDYSAKEIVIEGPKTLLTEWKDYLDRCKATLAPRTCRSYKNSYEAMEGFLKGIDQPDILPVNFNLKLYQSFRNYLSERYSPNTVARRIRHFKMVVNQGIPLGMDHKEIKYKESAGLKIALSQQELKSLIDLDLKTNRLRRVRDLLVVQCHTGVRVSDLFRLDKNIKGNFFEFRQTKTDVPVRIPILPVIRKILARYNYRLPKLSQQRYNDGIKKVYKELNKNATFQIRDDDGFKDVPVYKLISSHDAVRTFITISAERGVPVSSIAKITGKTISVLLKNYLVDSQRVAERHILDKWSNGVT